MWETNTAVTDSSEVRRAYLNNRKLITVFFTAGGPDLPMATFDAHSLRTGVK